MVEIESLFVLYTLQIHFIWGMKRKWMVSLKWMLLRVEIGTLSLSLSLSLSLCLRFALKSSPQRSVTKLLTWCHLKINTAHRKKKAMRHPFSYSFIFVLLNLSHALEMQLELLQMGDPEFPKIESSRSDDAPKGWGNQWRWKSTLILSVMAHSKSVLM